MYIGSSFNIEHRWKVHKLHLTKGIHPNNYLQNAWNKYGSDAFEFIIIEIVDKVKVRDYEQNWIDNLNCVIPLGYNIYKTAGSPLGYKHTKASLEKMIGVKKSDKVRANMSAAKKGHVTLETTKVKLSLIAKGKKLSKEHIENVIKANKGKRCRNFKEWPHELGKKCRCLECMEKKNRKYKEWKNKNNILEYSLVEGAVL